MNYTNNNIQTIPTVVYDIKNTHVYLLEEKTDVCYDENLELVKINALTLSESLSIRFKYTLGSLNFLFEQVSQKVVNANERNTLLDRIISLFTNLQTELSVINSENHVDKLISYINKEKLEIKRNIPFYL